MKFDPDRCRSLLFVPAGNDRYLDSALRGNSDVIQLDLEDAILPDQKESARLAAKKAIGRIHDAGRVGVVRVNGGLRLMMRDLESVVTLGLSGLTIPKVSTAEYLKLIDETLTEFEQDREMPVGEVRLIAQIESAEGVLNIREIAGSTPRLAAMGIGMVDLALDLGADVDADSLYVPSMQTLLAAREAGVTPLGYLGSITVYNEPETYRGWIRRARGLGFEGGFCIHPNQVEILNEEFLPSASEVEEARALIEAYEAHAKDGTGTFSIDGRMVDAPVVLRARRVLKRHGAVP